MSSLLGDLNPIQQEAVKATDGPVLILAGAGSGKTRVLTYRVAYLIQEKKVAPENILMMTFTNKAAGEMRDRIIKLLDYPLNPTPYTLPLMGTFHSFCAKVLRKEGHIIGLSSGFAIYDESDALDAAKEAMAVVNISIQKTSPYAVRSTISGAKNELISATEYPQYARGYFQENVAKIYLEYQKILERNKAVDFDDLMLITIRLFQHAPEVLAKYQLQFQYILIDEYQDTNAAQYLISKYLSKKYHNICVVGDAAQSIYAFRGADFRNIINFQKDYPQTKVFNLEQNYRSTQTILDAAYAVISKNKSHPILKLWTDKDGGEKVEIYQARNEVEEAQFVIDTIQSSVLSSSVTDKQKTERPASENRQLKTDNQTLSNFAVLFRTNAQSRSIEEQFLKTGIPYHLVGGINFYGRKEVKDMLAYLRLIQNPTDSVSLKRAEKNGKGRLSKVLELSNTITGEIQETTKDGGQASLLDEVPTKQSKTTEYSTHELLDMILRDTGYLAHIDDGTEDGKMRVENVKELRSVAEEFPNITDFLENVALIENAESPNSKRKKNNPEAEAVTLMTLHSAKGLEFPIVFMVGMEEGLFPHSRSMLNPNELEEERRLCYVGITRAKQRLYLIHTKQRLYFGQRTNNLSSRFLADIPQELVSSTTPYKDPYPEEDFKSDIYPEEDEWLN